MAQAYETFGLRVLEIVAPLVGVIKPQSAFFEVFDQRRNRIVPFRQPLRASTE